MKTIILEQGCKTQNIPRPEEGDVLVWKKGGKEQRTLVYSALSNEVRITWQEGAEKFGTCSYDYDSENKRLIPMDITNVWNTSGKPETDWYVQHLIKAGMWQERSAAA